MQELADRLGRELDRHPIAPAILRALTELSYTAHETGSSEIELYEGEAQLMYALVKLSEEYASGGGEIPEELRV